MRDALAPHPAYTRGGDTHAPRWQARSLPVRDVMSEAPAAIDLDAPLSDALQEMQERGAPHLLVYAQDPDHDGEQHLAGVVSDLDLVRALKPDAATESGGDSQTLRQRVFHGLTLAPITVGPEAPVSEAAALMLHHAIGCLPVCNTRGRVLGVVTNADLLHLLVA